METNEPEATLRNQIIFFKRKEIAFLRFPSVILISYYAHRIQGKMTLQVLAPNISSSKWRKT